MAITLYLRNTVNHVGSLGSHGNFDLENTTGTTATQSIGANTPRTFVYYSATTFPNLLDWQTGTYTWYIDVTVANANVQLTSIKISRYDSTLATEKASDTGTPNLTLNTTGVKTGTISFASPNPANRAADDRLVVTITISKLAGGGTQSVTIEVNGSGDSRLDTPISIPVVKDISEPSVSVSESLDDTEYYQKSISNEDSISTSDSIATETDYTKSIDDSPVISISDSIEGTKIPAQPAGKLWDVHFVEFPEDALDSISVVALGAKVQADKTHKYNIISTLETPADKTHKYDIISSVSTTKTHKYNVISSASVTKTHKYNIISTVSQTKTHKYDIIQKITQTRTHLYSVINSVSTTKTHLYNVSAPMAGVATTKTHKYNVIGLVSTTKTHRYDVAGLISTTKTHKYTILNTVPTAAKTHKYTILNLIQVTKTHKYSVIAYVSVQKTHLYAIYNKVTSQTKTHKYSLIQKLSTTTKTHKYNLSIAVSPPITKTHRFNLLTSAVTIKTHLYNIIGKVIRTRTHRWNAGGKVTATKTHKYEVGSGLVTAELGGSTQALIKFPERVRIVDIISTIQNLAISNVEIIQPIVPPNTAIALLELEEFRVTKTASAKRLQLRTASQLIVPQVQERIEHTAKCDYIAIEILPLDKLSLLVQSHIGIAGSKRSILIAAHTQIKQSADTIIKVASATSIEPHAQTRIASLSNLQLPYSFTRQLIKVQEIMNKEMANLYKTIIDILRNDELFK